MQEDDGKKRLFNILEKAQAGFAYEVMALQIQIEEQKPDKKSKKDNNISKITQLISLYMMAVQVLEGASDPRYKYFNKKIQSLMSRKHIVEELHVASTGKKASKELLASTELQQIKERKGEMDLQMFFNKEQFDSKKVKEFLSTAENKFKRLEGHISKDIKKQDEALEERLRLRKLRSENGSICKFKFTDQKSPHNNQSKDVKDVRMDYFDSPEPAKKRKGSIEKEQGRKKLLRTTSQLVL